MSTSVEKHTQTVESQESNQLSTIAHMPVKMQRFITLYLTGQYTLQKLAQLLELHPNTLTNWLQRGEVKDAIAEIQDQTHQQVATELKSLTLKATRKLYDLMDSPIDGVALQAVKDVLDRAGHKTKQEIKIDKTVTTIEEKFKELVESTIVDAEYTEVEE